MIPSSTDIIHTVEPFNTISNMFIPLKQKHYPEVPLYTNQGDFISPGSREWFTYMYELEKSLPRERILSPAEQKKLRCQQRQRDEIIQQEKAEADYHGTTVTKVDRRSNEKNYLTSKTNTFHNEMTERSQHYINAKDVKHQCQIQKEMYQFIKGFDFTRRSK